MRRMLWLAALFGLACTNGPTSPDDLRGAWAADFSIPGASLIVNLNQADGVITGDGTYSIEAGRSGTLQVDGTYAAPKLTMVIRRDFGLASTYTGTVLDSRHMSGTLADSLGHATPLSFTRR
jgi:hypothetical protein